MVFVRHALPGERVRARVTDGGPDSRFWRADAVAVLSASPDRVEPPCPFAGPGRCGGCDFQHVRPAAQRDLKAAVIREQLRALAGLDVPVTVEAVELPGRRDDGLAWRTRMQFGVGAGGLLGLRRHRSHELEQVTDCLIAHDRVRELDLPGRSWPGASAVEVVAPSGDGEPLVLVTASGRRDPRLPSLPVGVSVAVSTPDGLRRRRGRTWVAERVALPGGERTFRVSGSGFWQVHPQAPRVLVDAMLDAAAPQAGERAWDLYSGVGLFAAALAQQVGPSGSVLAVEGDPGAVRDARRNLHDLAQIRLVGGRVDRVLNQQPPGPVDVVVLDPPRAGARSAVVDAIARREPRVVAYVACDPATLARDLATFAEHGYRLAGLRAFDLFPQTHHVECVASLVQWQLS